MTATLGLPTTQTNTSVLDTQQGRSSVALRNVSIFPDTAEKILSTTLDFVRSSAIATQLTPRDLVSFSGLLTAQLLSEVEESAHQSGKKLLDYMYEKGFIAFSDRREMLKALVMSQHNVIYRPWLLKACRRAVLEFMPLEQVLEDMGISPNSAFCDNGLAELAQMSQIISRADFEKARSYALSHGVSFGRALVEMRLITAQVYTLLLDSLARYKAGMIDFANLKLFIRNGMTNLGTKSGMAINMQNLGGVAHYCHSRSPLMSLSLLVESKVAPYLVILSEVETALIREQTIEMVIAESDFAPAYYRATQLVSGVIAGNTSWQQAVIEMSRF